MRFLADALRVSLFLMVVERAKERAKAREKARERAPSHPRRASSPTVRCATSRRSPRSSPTP
jgi:hypothetical protein